MLLLLLPFAAQGKHVEPPQIQSITNRAIRYVVPNDKGLQAYIEAWDIQTGRKLWSKTIFTHWYIPPFGTECMYYEYLTSMKLVKDELLITSERGRVYGVNIHTKSMRRIKLEAPKSERKKDKTIRRP